MTRFSANLGFLWTEMTLPDAIRAAKAAGFAAVECHWPYDMPAEDVRAALEETGLPMLGLNTRRGDVAAGENGLTALPGREAEAAAAIAEALDYAAAVGAGAVHVMSGFAEGDAARETLVGHLRAASERAAALGVTLLIEPLNRFDAPGYFLQTCEQAADLIDTLGRTNLKLMFDCYHVARTQGDVLRRLADFLPVTGHIQFASVPDRGAPDHGEIAYPWLFDQIKTLGWSAPLGAEYKPGGLTDDTLGWMTAA